MIIVKVFPPPVSPPVHDAAREGERLTLALDAAVFAWAEAVREVDRAKRAPDEPPTYLASRLHRRAILVAEAQAARRYAAAKEAELALADMELAARAAARGAA